MLMNPLIFRKYDIRGTFEEQFDEDFAYYLGKAICVLVKSKTGQEPVLSLGYDARLSSPQLVKAVCKGLLESGAEVIHLGLITTPMSYFSTFLAKDTDHSLIKKINGSVMVTASHNPPKDNGFKISVGTHTISGTDIQKLRQIIESGEFLSGEGRESEFNIIPDYIESYKKDFGKIKNVPVVLDCSNGTAGVVARDLYKNMGLTPKVLFEEPDGCFPNHHPDPTIKENTDELAKVVKETGSIVGFGFDGDSDRLGLVDHKGRFIYGDHIIALCARFILEKHPGSTIVADVKCSDEIFGMIKKWGGHPVMCKTGHSLVKEQIQNEGAAFGGELSGHLFFTDRHYGFDDALYASLRILEFLTQSGLNVEDILKEIPPTFSTKELRLHTTEDKKQKIVDVLKNHFREGGSNYEVNLLDGLRVKFKNRGWALARVSHTQPVLVLRFEAKTQKDLDEIRKQFENIVHPLL